MKKNVILSLLLLSAATTASAQGYKEGDNLFSLGIGVGTPFFGSGYSTSIPVNPVISYEKGIEDNISVGGSVAFASSKYTSGSYKLKYNAIYLGARGSYHFEVKNPKLDPYVGGSLGYVILTVSDNAGYNGAVGSSSLGYGIFAGGRYYFAGKTAVYAEVGYASLSVLNIGITFKM